MREPQYRWPPNTTAHLVRLYEITLPLLVALRAVAAPQALRRGARPVPASVLAEARTVLAEARRVLSREPVARGLLELGAASDWAGLATKLELALAAFATFRATYSYTTRAEGHTWRDQEWLSFTYSRARSASADNDLHES